MIWLIITIAVILLYLFALAPRLSRRDAMRAFSGTMFAHRGYHCKERGIPENSMKAFRAAIARGYGIELDLHLTKRRPSCRLPRRYAGTHVQKN
ncbi:MAG: glycerophosphodiester phosphodiesterase family protein [[Clostridium] scindens]